MASIHRFAHIHS
ncbi:hypothetical protein GQ607_009027 [Colletotrichum asianum]|uniref:Uncharacterized protein n=1 Tax=Colletotrichum asianum TaxID=702518 RepID=A0A8H3W9I0_9PEZI|nr:hypothetical protein GQ607_009027 [Colletotrichum asianum]